MWDSDMKKVKRGEQAVKTPINITMWARMREEADKCHTIRMSSYLTIEFEDYKGSWEQEAFKWIFLRSCFFDRD